jgi:hypothetical protein
MVAFADNEYQIAYYNENNEYESDYESIYSDEEEEEEQDVYEPEEISKTRFNIVICELYNWKLHGKPSKNSNIDKHYLVVNRFKRLNIKSINIIASYINSEYRNLSNKKHNIFINYENIILQNNYIKPEIAECMYLNDNECVAILKTFWIKIIQRKWKNIYKERKEILKKRCTLNALRFKELYGTWPDYCFHYPSLRGMLSNLL